MGIFKAYDIRGVYPTELDEVLARKIGHAFAVHFEQSGRSETKRVVVGRDMRSSAPSIQKALMEGLCAAGWSVIDVGMCSTPMNYFCAGTLPVDGAICVTASHNPGHYIGFKLSGKGAQPISKDTGIGQIEKLVATELPKAAKPGTIEKKDMLDGYVQHVLRFAGGLASLKVGIDCANGMAGFTLPKILDRLPMLKTVQLYFEPDGTFPNHEANPLKLENLHDLQAIVRKEKLDVGLSFDGDADRCAFVDEHGEPVGNDIVTALIARELLKTSPGSGIVYDLRSSWAVPEVISKAGGKPLCERVGHSFMKATLRKEGGVCGGELSGHYYFRENFYADSAEIAAFLVLRMISESKKSLSQLVAELPRYHATGEVNFEVEHPQQKIAEIRALYVKKGGAASDLDGATVAFGKLGDADWWWFNLRPSNTEPLVRLNLEARRPETLAAKKRELLALLGEPV
ncbi:MAG: phosphomannomutase/phosphoglucomutase [Planctomycetes bacterium]|nr:phosphomannomutase/phosphoglucomutase [Planctomycetota bacterium]